MDAALEKRKMESVGESEEKGRARSKGLLTDPARAGHVMIE